MDLVLSLLFGCLNLAGLGIFGLWVWVIDFHFEIWVGQVDFGVGVRRNFA